MIALLLFILPCLAAKDPVFLRPGALVAPKAKLALVEDYVWIKYPHNQLFDISTRLGYVLDSLDAILHDMDETVRPGSYEIFALSGYLSFDTTTIQNNHILIHPSIYTTII